MWWSPPSLILVINLSSSFLFILFSIKDDEIDFVVISVEPLVVDGVISGRGDLETSFSSIKELLLVGSFV